MGIFQQGHPLLSNVGRWLDNVRLSSSRFQKDSCEGPTIYFIGDKGYSSNHHAPCKAVGDWKKPLTGKGTFLDNVFVSIRFAMSDDLAKKDGYPLDASVGVESLRGQVIHGYQTSHDVLHLLNGAAKRTAQAKRASVLPRPCEAGIQVSFLETIRRLRWH